MLVSKERDLVSTRTADTIAWNQFWSWLGLGQLLRNHASDPNLISAVLQRVSEVKNLGSRHQAQLDWYRCRWSAVQLPPLFAEMFDIPRGDDDLAWLWKRPHKKEPGWKFTFLKLWHFEWTEFQHGGTVQDRVCFTCVYWPSEYNDVVFLAYER